MGLIKIFHKDSKCSYLVIIGLLYIFEEKPQFSCLMKTFTGFFFQFHEEAIVSLKFEDLFFQLTIYGIVA